MPDEKQDDVNQFDIEPSTTADESLVVEHADLKHRVESVTTPDPEPVPTAVPTAAPAQPASAVPEVAPVPSTDELPKPGPGTLVLQWLTYAFWGWTVLSLSGLILIVVNQLLDQTRSRYDSYSWFGGGIAYLLAAVIVLFIIAIVCDIFYARLERRHSRSTGSNVVMIIHAVIFALFAIGSLIAAVFSVVGLAIGDATDTSGPVAGIVTGVVVALIYGVTLIRTLNPKWLGRVAAMYWLIMSTTIIITVIMAIVGPAAQARLANQDQKVESGVSDVVYAVRDYVDAQQKLPSTLSELDGLSEDTQKVVDDGKITYTAKEQLSGSTSSADLIPNGSDGSSSLSFGRSSSTTPGFHYELCATYETEIKDGYNYSSRSSYGSNNRYDTTANVSSHGKGKVCYDLQTDYIY